MSECTPTSSYFNPRAPCGARPPARTPSIPSTTDFNPRAPCGARQPFLTHALQYKNISIHAPRAGRDIVLAIAMADMMIFQSTRPVRGATKRNEGLIDHIAISIHAPRAGRDCCHSKTPPCQYHFNPRAPCGARRIINFKVYEDSVISIHAPRAGRDAAPGTAYGPPAYFNPRAPCGARQQKYTKLLYTLLRQKAIFRQFHAKRRLLKRFSTYKYRNTFLICSANRMGKICTLPLRTTRSLDLPEGMSACSQSARFCFRTFFPSSKTADYPAPDP